MKRAPKVTRTNKEQAGVVKKQQPKQNNWSESYGINKIRLTDSQKEFVNKVKSNDLVFCVGPAGTGKTLATLHYFVSEYLIDSSKQIIFIKTPVEAGMDKIGALPDALEDKIQPHFAYARKLLGQLLSPGKVDTDTDHRIHFKVPNFCLGETFDNALICIDEAQQLSPMILKLLLERTGMHSKVVVLGDNSQIYTDIRGRAALADALKRFFDSTKQFNSRYPGIALHQYTVDDVMRSDLVKHVITAYNN